MAKEQKQKKRPNAYAEVQRGLTRYVWRFEGMKYRTPSSEDPDEAYADAMEQITAQMRGTWKDRSGAKMLLEDWIDVWREFLDVEETTLEKYKYLIEFHILPEFGEKELGELSFEDIEKWERAIPTRISTKGHPIRPVGRARRPQPADHDPRRRRSLAQDRVECRRTAQGA
jgi:hypothetical protein